MDAQTGRGEQPAVSRCWCLQVCHQGRWCPGAECGRSGRWVGGKPTAGCKTAETRRLNEREGDSMNTVPSSCGCNVSGAIVSVVSDLVEEMSTGQLAARVKRVSADGAWVVHVLSQLGRRCLLEHGSQQRGDTSGRKAQG